MESRPQNPEFRNNPENFHQSRKPVVQKFQIETESQYDLKFVTSNP